MRGVLAAKALFMIAVIIAVTFTVSDLSQVKAEEQKKCCEVTNAGDICVYTTEDNCNYDYLTSDTVCEQTTFCEPGCCVSPEGLCSASVSKSTCENVPGYTWNEGAACDLAQCQKGCCVIGGAECAYTTQSNCQEILSAFEDLSLDWRSVESESACSEVCTAIDKGCCVTADSCTYITKGMCTDSGIDMTSGYGFYDEVYCSDFGGCGCAEHAEMKCVGEDVYWFDSCGNQEEVAKDCDYTDGTFCGRDDSGNYLCESTACEDTFDGIYSIDDIIENRDTHDSKFGEQRENGETWCVYESPAGGWFDRPGSQHYRGICLFGEEVLEPCTDNREEVCIQYPYTSYYNTTIMEDSFLWNYMTNEQQYETFVEAGAACIDNGFNQNMINGNVTTVPTAETSIEECAKGTQTCPVTFAKDSNWGNWYCASNCYCLSQEWVNTATSYCAIQGDCGAKYNLVNKYSDDGFYVTRSLDYVGESSNATYVGYDTECKDVFSGELDPQEEDCVGACDGSSGDEECSFFSKPSDTYIEKLNDNYGVYGGLIGFSKFIEEIMGQAADLGWESGWNAVAIGAAVAVVLFIINAVFTTSVVGFVVGGVGATMATTGVVTTTASAVTSFLTGPFLAAGAAVPGPGWVIAAVVVIVAAIVYLFYSGGMEMTVDVVAKCEPWVVPTGGDYCTLCDVPVSEGGLAIDDGAGNILKGYECSEYKCTSLGALCTYIPENAGSERAKCVAENIGDTNSPYIWNASLLGDYATLPVEFVPNERLIVKENVEPYTYFEFGIETDEISQCKISTELPTDFDTMTMYFPSSYYDYVHNQSWVLMPGQQYNFYINCQDINGNNRESNFFEVEVNVNDGPDMMPPVIEATSIENGGYVPAGVTEEQLTIFLDEPGSCKWSNTDAEYSLMENYFLCDGIPLSASPYLDNGCTTLLNVAEGMNTYYFACEDATGNINTDNYLFNLQSTNPLSIEYATPSGTLYYDYTEMMVGTSGGAEAGKAVCSYDGIEFFETNAAVHRQTLQNLNPGVYDYDIYCSDVAGNENTTKITFTIEIDNVPPSLTSLYQSGSNVYFTLDESASCEYSYQSFIFGSGTSVSGSFATTELETYYLTCEDLFGNQASWTINI